MLLFTCILIPPAQSSSYRRDNIPLARPDSRRRTNYGSQQQPPPPPPPPPPQPFDPSAPVYDNTYDPDRIPAPVDPQWSSLEDDYSQLQQQSQSQEPQPFNNWYEERRTASPLQQRQIPPPPGQPPAYINRSPIHYEFAAKPASSSSSSSSDLPEARKEDDDDIPRTYSALESSSRIAHDEDDDRDRPKFASARRDAVTRYMSTRRGRASLRLSSTLVGAGFGTFVGRSLLGRNSASQTVALTMAVLFLLGTFLNNSDNVFAELSKAMGLALIFAVQRYRRIQKQYPTWYHIKASLGMVERRPFPPTENPWAYRPEDVRPDDDDHDIDMNYRSAALEFNMLYTIIAMAFCGSACGGNVPLLPTWMGALAGAGTFVLACQARNARGDLARSMGMRVVSLGQEMVEMNRELGLLVKLGRVSARILDKLMVLDRKHNVRDRVVSAVSFLYDQISATASRMQTDIRQQQEGRRDQEPPRGNRRRDDEPWAEEELRPGRRRDGPRQPGGRQGNSYGEPPLYNDDKDRRPRRRPPPGAGGPYSRR